MGLRVQNLDAQFPTTQKGVKRQYFILHCQEARYLGQITFSKDDDSSQMLFCNWPCQAHQETLPSREGIHFLLPWVWVFPATTLINSIWQTWCCASFRLSLIWLTASSFGLLECSLLWHSLSELGCHAVELPSHMEVFQLAALASCSISCQSGVYWAQLSLVEPSFQPSWAFRWLQPQLTLAELHEIHQVKTTQLSPVKPNDHER